MLYQIFKVSLENKFGTVVLKQVKNIRPKTQMSPKLQSALSPLGYH